MFIICLLIGYHFPIQSDFRHMTLISYESYGFISHSYPFGFPCRTKAFRWAASQAWPCSKNLEYFGASDVERSMSRVKVTWIPIDSTKKNCLIKQEYGERISTIVLAKQKDPRMSQGPPTNCSHATPCGDNSPGIWSRGLRNPDVPCSISLG